MKIAVIGAGSWGTALAQVLAGNGHNVGLWARKPEVVHGHQRRAPQPALPERTRCCPSDIVATTVASRTRCMRAKAAVIVTPSNLLRGVARVLLRRCADPSTSRSSSARRASRKAAAFCPSTSLRVRDGRPRAPRGALGSQPRRGGHPRRCRLPPWWPAPRAGHGRVLPATCSPTEAFRTYTSDDVMRRGAVRRVQERHRHRRGPVLRHGVRRQHGRHAHDARPGRDEPLDGEVRRASHHVSWAWRARAT